MIKTFLKTFKKAFFIFISFCFMFFLSVFNTYAEGEFTTNFDVTYKVSEGGVTEVTNKITLTNVFSNMYATSYTIVLDSINPTNVKVYGIDDVTYTDKSYPINIEKENNTTTLKIEFPDTVVGKDKSRTFFVSFEEPSFAVRTGEVWEISIPRIDEKATFSSYSLNLLVPEKFGQEAYISPQPKTKSIESGFHSYKFTKQEIEKTGVVAGFGAFQVFNFNLNYHLENPLTKTAKTEITLPPDTAYQRVYYDDINPRPTKLTVDIDGNWIAEYTLSPRQRLDINARGNVQIFSNYRPFSKPTQESLNYSLTNLPYWDTNNPEIVKLANELKTPRAIYDYVSNKLKYDYERVKPNVERLGAVSALASPASAICMEFTDLFVAIARSAGIPAREINGFAYTENPEIQPLSLVNDVLHAWPEYYDSETEVWVPVDPTWGSTTGGVDYFNKLDLRHFTFVIHGKDSKTPYAAGSYKLGANPQKDVFVTFGSLPTNRNANLNLTASLKGWIPFVPNQLDINIENNGPTAIYNVTPKVYFDSVEVPFNDTMEILLPFQNYDGILDVPFSFLGTKTPNNVKIVVEGNETTVSTNKQHVLIYNLLFIFTVSIIILVTIAIRLKKWKFPKKNS